MTNYKIILIKFDKHGHKQKSFSSRLSMASNTEKFDTFVATTMGDKDVTAIPGIGKAFGTGLRAQNIKKV